MTVETVAGTKIYIASAIPATFDVAGYGALTWILIGEVTDGGGHGRTYAVVNHQPIATRGTRKYKGSFNEGSKTLAVAIDTDDVGQIACASALLSDADFSFKVAYQGGDIDYMQAKVVSFPATTAGVDSMRTGSIGLEITTTKTGVGIVSFNAP